MMSTTESPHRAGGFGRLSLEVLLIFVGVSGAFLVESYRDSQEAMERAELIAGALYQDLGEAHQVMEFFVSRIDEGLAAFDARLQSGEHPVPYVFEIRGSRTPPPGVWAMAAEVGLREIEDPGLMFELSFFYNENSGVSDNYSSYADFTDRVFWPLALSDTSAFYDQQTGQLRGDFAAHVQQLRDYRDDVVRLGNWAASLQVQLRTAVPDIAMTPPASIEENRYESSVRQR